MCDVMFDMALSCNLGRGSKVLGWSERKSLESKSGCRMGINRPNMFESQIDPTRHVTVNKNFRGKPSFLDPALQLS